MSKPTDILRLIYKDFIDHHNQGYFLFKCWRVHPWFRFKRKDNNSFTTAYILHRLLKNKDYFAEKGKNQIEEIKAAFIEKIDNYAHVRKTDPSFNFYQNHPESNFFPNSNFLRKIKRFKLADEIDTSALVYQILDDKENLNAFFELAKSFSNKSKQNHLPKNLQDFEVYGTWLGSETAFEIDLCVLCNFLELKLSTQSELETEDKECIRLFQYCINEHLIKKTPCLLSPSYQKPLVIYYHLARFYNLFPEHFEQKTFQNLLQSIDHYQCQNETETFIKNAAFRRLGIDKRKEIKLGEIDLYFPWFKAAFLSGIKSKLIKKIAFSNLFQMQYTCPALILAIALEELIFAEHENSRTTS